MARMPSKRWEQFERQVMKTIGTRETIPAGEFAANMFLTYRRQHNAFVRLVKKLPTYDPATTVSGMQRIDQGQWVRLDTILAALQQGGKK